MTRGKFFIGTITVKKSEPSLPADIKLPSDIDTVTGLFFNISPFYTDYNPTPPIGKITISLDNGGTNIINEVEVNTERDFKDMVKVNEKIYPNTFARVIYKDLGVPAVHSEYKVKLYFNYEKKPKQCTKAI